jgi:hypothetical protein
MNDRQLLWQQKLEELSTIRDDLDEGIDAGIKGAVAALQFLGLHTIQSCEGHLGRGEAAPWVEIESPEVRTLRPRMRELDEQRETLEEDDEACERVSQELQKAVQEARRLNAWPLKK